MMSATAWNSLEIAKLVVGVLTPLLLVGLGVLINRATRRIEDAQWANRRLIEKRIEIYDEMAPLLNGLYCFFRCIGNFQEVTPPNAVELKRQLDKLFHVNRFLFDDAFARRYEEFMEACFLTYTGIAQPAKLRALVDWQRQERQDRWQLEWAACFAPDGAATELKRLIQLFNDLMDRFAANLGMTDNPARARVI